MTRAPFLAVVFVFTAAAVGCVAGDDELEISDDDLVVSAEDEAEDAAFDAALADGKADAALSYNAVAQLAKNAGLSCSGDRIAIAVAVAKAESGFRPRITNTVGNTRGVDRGLWQINSYWHPNVSDACAFSPSCNARAMARISSMGSNWRPWWTFVHGKHQPFMSQSRAAKRAVCGS
jgi:hypothetical protein